MSKDTLLGATAGTAGFTFPWWNEFVHAATGMNQLLVSVLGLIVLLLTVRKLLLDIRVSQKKLGGE